MRAQGATGTPPWTPRPLSAFDVAKAEWLIRNRLPCLGCHELGGEGGRIGPSLSALKGRRTPDRVYSMIRDPQGAIMPRVPMSQATLDLIASRSEEHTSELQSQSNLVCRLLLEKK